MSVTVTEGDFNEFKAEALELLGNAEQALLSLSAEAAFEPVFNTVFRCIHNLKGAAGMMDMLELQAHTHELETSLLQFKGAAGISCQFISYFLAGLDRALSLLNGHDPSSVQASAIAPVVAVPVVAVPVVATPESAPPESGGPSKLDGAFEEFFAESQEILARIDDSLNRLESAEAPKDLIDSLYREFHSLKGSAYLFSQVQLGDIAHAVETSLEPLRDSASPPAQAQIDLMFASLKQMEAALQDARGSKLPVGAPPPEAELSLPLPPTECPPVEAPGAKPPGSVPSTAKDKESENGTIRVSVSLLDSLMALTGEMVLVRNQVMQFANKLENVECLGMSKRLNSITTEIQDGLMKTRMQPIGNVLSKFNRVTRDLSQELGKNISLTLSGAETELDKSLLEAIKDPLTHIVRNSCDHGIEMPAQRREAGKPAHGTIAIKAYHEGGHVVIEVRDDGKGLNRDVLLKKGLEKGLITDAQSKNLSEREVLGLIFAPGFSTAAKVTNVSGRGVGMDVVRTNIERIGGTVELASAVGVGTTISIKIPLTLAIIPALIIKDRSETFAIPQVKLLELVRVDLSSGENKIEYIQGAPVYRLRGNLLPLVSLSQVLGLDQIPPSSAPTLVNIAILNADNRSFGLIVEEIHDTGDIVVKPLNRLLKSLQVYAGATIMGDGSIALILDVMGLSKHAQIGSGEKGAELRDADALNQQMAAAEHQDYILLKLNSPAKHAMVLGYVHRLEEFKRTDIEFDGSKTVIRYRDSLLHVVSANRALGYEASAAGAARETVHIVVVEKAGRLFGIEVDEILDTLSSAVDPAPSLSKKAGVFGSLNTAHELLVLIEPFELIESLYGPSDSKAIGMRPKSSAHKKLRILLAEDTVFFRKAISAVLTNAGHQVVHAHDGQEAWEIFTAGGQHFDLVVSDVEMPRLNGFGLAKAIRAAKTNAQVPLLAISSRSDASHRSEGLAAGFDVYLEKLKPDFLLQTVVELTTGCERKAA